MAGRRRRHGCPAATHWLLAAALPGCCAAAAVHRRAFLARASARAGRGAPKVCVDTPAGWRDVTLNGCEHYASRQFCTADGGYGPGWDQATWGNFSKWSVSKAAPEACCACGGGTEGEAAGCPSFTCPSGYSQKADAASLYCQGFSCTLDDLETCCEAPPEVQAAVTQTKELIKSLKEEVKANVSSEGEALLQKLAADAEESRKDKVSGMQSSWGASRSEAIAAARSAFDAETAGAGSLASAAAYEIAAAGYAAAKHEMKDAAVVDQGKLQALMQHAAASFGRSTDEWRSTIQKGKELQQLAREEWRVHHADLNATWPLVLRGIAELNAAINKSSEPGNNVRWAAQSSRLASDLSQTARSNAQGLMAQAEAAESRTKAALALTGSNSGKLDDLEALVTRIGASLGR